MQDKYLLRREMLEAAGISPVTQWRLEKRGEFPKRRQISPNRVGWLESEITEWMLSRPVSDIDAVWRGGKVVSQSDDIPRPLGSIIYDTQTGLYAFMPVDGISSLPLGEWRDWDQLIKAICQACKSNLFAEINGSS